MTSAWLWARYVVRELVFLMDEPLSQHLSTPSSVRKPVPQMAALQRRLGVLLPTTLLVTHDGDRSSDRHGRLHHPSNSACRSALRPSCAMPSANVFSQQLRQISSMNIESFHPTVNGKGKRWARHSGCAIEGRHHLPITTAQEPAGGRLRHPEDTSPNCPG